MRSEGPWAARTARGFAWLFAVCLLVASPAAASHADGRYDQPVWFRWATTRLDVLVIPPTPGQIANGNGLLNGLRGDELTPWGNSYLRAIRLALADWQRAIAELGAPWLADTLEIRVWVAGLEPVPLSVLVDPEIVITTDLTKGPVYGFATRVGDRTCLIDNSKLFVTSFAENDMYNVTAHEFGHCLGLRHVGTSDASLDDDHPDGDVMDGRYEQVPGALGNDRACVSNLNVLGVEAAFSQAAGRGPGPSTVSVPVAGYHRLDCRASR